MVIRKIQFNYKCTRYVAGGMGGGGMEIPAVKYTCIMRQCWIITEEMMQK